MKRFFILAALICFLFSGCSNVPTITTTSSPSGSTGQTGTPHWGTRTKTSGCTVNGALQDTACTPGDIIANVTKSQVCTSGYSSSVRNVPTSEKNQDYAEYSIAHHTTGQYEVDHLVSLELGGSNDISNLWPEAASPKPGFHEKDKVENYLHAQVCSGALSLQQAQIEIATNWLTVYKQMPSSAKSSGSQPELEPHLLPFHVPPLLARRLPSDQQTSLQRFSTPLMRKPTPQLRLDTKTPRNKAMIPPIAAMLESNLPLRQETSYVK